MTNEEMSMKTKLALANALKAAMKTKKLSKITVSELICACDINRKTFYYHFQDIYDLLKWTLERETLDVVKNFDLIINTEEAIRFLMDYTEKNNYIVNGAFDSMGYEELKRFFHNDLFSVIYGAIENGEGKLHVQLEPQFKQSLRMEVAAHIFDPGKWGTGTKPGAAPGESKKAGTGDRP